MKIKLFESFRKSLVDQKCDLLDELTLPLKDLGLEVIISKKPIYFDGFYYGDIQPYTLNLYTGTGRSIILMIKDNYSILKSGRMLKNDIIEEFLLDLNAFGMIPRQSGGGDKFCYMIFDKWGKMTDSEVLKKNETLKNDCKTFINMRWIKLFESFDDDNYISKSIRDILVELEDNGMQVKIKYQPESFKYDRPSYALEEPKKTIIQPYVVIEIKGKHVDCYPYAMQEEFEISSVRDYIDTVVDFIEDIWPSYDLYFEKYGVDDAHINDGKVLTDGKCGSLVIQIHKREI